jgi:hypothetical protein
MVADRVAAPVEYAWHFTERLLMMPHTYVVNDYRQQAPHPPFGTAAQFPDNLERLVQRITRGAGHAGAISRQYGKRLQEACEGAAKKP